jgi:hypothetical protein
MSVIEEVRRDREDLARVLKKHAGIRKLVEELYPDSAHFIYELLQNAEDTGATEAHFTLSRTNLIFEHDGRPFERQDIFGITDIGEGGKGNDNDKIGRFGVGFKAVFAYSETPHIWSPTFCFKITDLVLPDALDLRDDLGNRTRFEFPFNNPKKDIETAYAEIEKGLNELAETTLLFLPHLTKISWQIDQKDSGAVQRVHHSQNHSHFEVLKQLDGKTAGSFHFLKFDNPVEGLQKQRVAVAFALDFLPNIQQYDHRKPLAKQLRIVPVTGKVAVYFPAAKETSGLRFHLHAPFVPELSRASIKQTPANDPLFQQLATLTASSLHGIRDLGLLTGDFLAVLPNPQDAVLERYKPIRAAIVDEMNTQQLTPTHAKSHAPAKHLLQARASLKDLLSKEDLEFLIDYDEQQPQWAIGATQKNSNIDRFLDGLAITEWDSDKFVELIDSRASEKTRYVLSPPHYVKDPDPEFMKWLSGKPLDWHQDLYALLFEHLSNAGWRKSQLLENLKLQRIVRRSDGTYGNAKNSFFPSDGVDHDEVLPRVDRGVYTSGKSKTQQQNARTFLEEIGVREVGESEQVEAILEQRYTNANFRPLKQDLKRFIALVDKDPTKTNLFANYFIFELKDGKWGMPTQVFLDRPFKDTGLSFYYQICEKPTRFALADRYQDGQIAISKLVKFAESVSVQIGLEIETVSCRSNPDWPYLSSVGGDRQRSPIDRDYLIPGLETLLANPSVDTARLVWRTMSSLPQYPNYLQATFQRNDRAGSHHADSQFVHHLRESAWVPQGDGLFVRPDEASRDLLPEGFPFDPGWPWLKAIHFGLSVLKKSEEQRQKQDVAKELGFADSESLERAQRFVALPAEEQLRILADQEWKAAAELPDHEPSNPDRRAERVGGQAATAPDRHTEERTRSVSIGLEIVKQEAAQYLLGQYTNSDGEMICQVCKGPQPFKLDDGTAYFEKVEFLLDLKKRHYQNYLALCPNHGAMFQHANGSSDSIRSLFVEMTNNELKVVLAQRDMSIYFTKVHIADLKAVIQAENVNQSGAETESD